MKKFLFAALLISLMASGFMLISLGNFGAAAPAETPGPTKSPNPNKPTPEPTPAVTDQSGNSNGNSNAGSGNSYGDSNSATKDNNGNNEKSGVSNGNANGNSNGNGNNGDANGNGSGNGNSKGNNGDGNNGNYNIGVNGNSGNNGNSNNGNNDSWNGNNGNSGNGNNGNGNGRDGTNDNNGNNGNGNNGNGNANGDKPSPTPTPAPTTVPNQNSLMFKISGYILDSNGCGLAGAMIIFNVPNIVPAVYSDYSGFYVMYAPSGTYHVNVWPPFDSNYIRYDEQALVVKSDITKNITLISGYKVSGYLTDLAGEPVSKAIVSLNNNLISGWFSNSSGYYFVSAPAGTYKLSVGPSTQYIGDFPRYSESNFIINGNIFKNITLGAPVPTESPTPSPTPSSATPPAQSSYKISGYIRDTNGNGIAAATILFNVPQLVPSVRSDPSGYYVMYAPAGIYHVNVWPPFDSNFIYYDYPTLVVGADITKDITLLTGYKISGYITDYAGTPVSGATIKLSSYGTGSGFGTGWFSNYMGYYFTTAPSGTYRISIIPDPNVPTISFPSYYEDNVVIKGDMVKNIRLRSPETMAPTIPPSTPTPIQTSTPTPSPSPKSSSSSLNVQFDTKYDGQANFTSEKTHTSPRSVELILPSYAQQGSSATALYSYNGTLASLSTFSIYTSYTNATPRFVIYLDINGDGSKDVILLSDYQTPSNGQWSISTGGLRWDWTQTDFALTSYGTTWKSLDSWKTTYGDAKIIGLGIALEYWAVADSNGLGQPLYADELIINGELTGLTYSIASP